jgi:hypothetical protein
MQVTEEHVGDTIGCSQKNPNSGKLYRSNEPVFDVVVGLFWFLGFFWAGRLMGERDG